MSSSPILISDTSSGLYVPIHKRNRSTSSSYSSTRSLSPLSSRGASPLRSIPCNGVYSPAELLSLAQSPLALALVGDMNARLRAIAPEVVQTRKQRKALAWHARAPAPITTATGMHKRGQQSHGHTSESEEDRTTWRRA